MNRTKLITAALGLIVIGSVSAQPRLVDREAEKREFPDLQRTELAQERNIADAYKRLSEMGFLVSMSQQDRATAQKEAEPGGELNFRNTFRFIKYTPRNTYIRYVKEDPQFLLNTFGTVEEVRALVAEQVRKAQSRGVKATELQFQTRDGIELTQFDFIYSNDPDARRAVGSRRKTLTLFFTQTNQQADTEQKLQLSLVVGRVVEDNFREGVRNVQLIIDMTPSGDPADTNMDDVIIIDRYNQKPTNAAILGMMSNTANFPHRVRFKQRYYIKMLDHFHRLYAMVANYATKDDNDYNEEVIEKVEQSMDY